MKQLSKAITAIQLFAIKIIFGKEWCIMMAMFFAQRVILGKTTFEQVPKALKKGVAEVLIDSGLPEWAPPKSGGTADGKGPERGGGRSDPPPPNGKEQTMIGFVVGFIVGGLIGFVVAALLAAGRSEL